MSQKTSKNLQYGIKTIPDIIDDITELYTQSPSATSDIEVNTLTANTISSDAVVLTTQPVTSTATTASVNTLIVDSNGNVKKKAQSNVKVFRGLITQTGTGNPVVSVLENSFGGTMAITRQSAGFYKFTLTGAFTSNTVVNGKFTSQTGSGVEFGVLGDVAGTFWYYNFDTAAVPNDIYLAIYNSGFSGQADLSTVMGTTPLYIEIISYPA